MSSDFSAPGTSFPPLPPPAPRVDARAYRNPFLPVVLSLFPGGGQIYNGQPAKGVVFFFSWVGSIYGAAFVSPFPFGFMIPFVYIYNLIDAYRSARAMQERAAGGDLLLIEDEADSPAWGASLMVVGLLLLLNNLGWIELISFRRYWPVLMIVAGGSFLWSSLKRKDAGSGDERPL